MRPITTATTAMTITAAFLLAACAGSDEATDTPPTDDAEAGSVEPAETDPAASDPVDPADDATDDAAPETEPTDTETTVPSTGVAPAVTAPAPPTTEPGPLPTPEVQLIPVGSFDQPVDLAWRFIDPRFFVVEQDGRIVAFDDESSVPVLDIDDVDGVSLSRANEQGLLGLAFHPDEDLAYVNLTNDAGTTVIAEFVVDPFTAEFDAGSYREVITIDQPFDNHNGGDLEFGPDGHLYIATGDGGSGGDPERTALDLTSRLGKLLRIDPLLADDGSAFTVPADNPFLGADDADPTIWSYGLRNPWKIDFDDDTGDLWIADVGQNAFEEISMAPAVDGVDAGRGLSFGWSAFEGDERFNDDQSADGHVPPVVTYAHSDGGCSVSGGVVARNSSYPDLDGWYVFGDLCTGQVWALDTTSVTISDSTRVGEPILQEIANVAQLVAVRTGPDGDLYALSISGEMFRIVQA